MLFERIYDKTLAQASYVIGCQAKGVAAVVDPKRDVDTYIDFAAQNGMQITHIFETHIHADFLSGSRELAQLTGAKMYLSDEGGPSWQYEFPHEGLHHGDKLALGNLVVEVLHTPGHTPEHISFLITDTPASEEPAMLLTGDFVFVGDVGRPDLLEQAAGMVGTQEVGAAQMYDSLSSFAQLPDYIQVWPGHGAGSACGKALGAVPMTTVGYEKIRNWAVKLLNDKSAFMEELLADQPEPPKYFAMMKKINKENRGLVTAVPKFPHLSQSEWTKHKSSARIVDTRNFAAYAEGFLPSTINIANTGAFATYMGWLIGYEEPFILIAKESETEDLARKLMRIGLDQHIGFITPEELKIWEADHLDRYQPVNYADVKKAVQEKSAQIIDVRGASEYKINHIPGALHLFYGTIANHLEPLSATEPIIIHCQTGIRAAIAHSLLMSKGYHNVKVYWGGMEDWASHN